GLPFGGLDYDWSVVDLPDGGSTLVLRIFPFVYNPLTLRAGYYRSYRFDLTYAQSTAHIAALELGGEEHRLGQPVTVNLALANPGAASDVVVELAIRRAVDGEIVDGLPLRLLAGFAGPASFSAVWPAASIPPGSYQIEARLLDMEGIVLDRRAETFLLGVMAGEIAQFRVGPGHFAIGQPLNLALSFANPGDLPANGLLSIRVYNDAGALLDELTQDVSNVNPGQTTRFTAQWPTAGRPRGRYNFVANVLLGGPSAGPARASASTELYLYLPVTVK
ncbi:MAG: hypothetical protein LC131_17705, partial [Anaerolineae bacterium]|nr:hypothetical protein [Anaerolineae bacterium]